ncbi:hypothetical protein LCS84_001198 [Salmonella enterica]|nr:hypothetical protein [Salmonella enterica]EHE9120021.1 hypothetical protein [Salmonella enterica]EHM3822056.1 hypothetical protein [Salmonella enterica]EIE0009909.1 hypothetical protein [Salmonella enterica]EIP8898687.1 hypothetical protein [Salmonella enterica]
MVGRRGNEIFNSAGRVAVKYKAKSVPTFTLPPKGVIMRTIVQKGCTTVTMLHQNSASM